LMKWEAEDITGRDWDLITWEMLYTTRSTAVLVIYIRGSSMESGPEVIEPQNALGSGQRGSLVTNYGS
jgi:hypothetical protein